MLDAVSSQLEHYMNLLSTRQKLVVSNIANLDTPGYKTQDIDFHFEFISKMDESDPSPPTVFDAGGNIVKNDGNDVSLDQQMRLLSENAIRFSVASNLLKSQMATMKTAIAEGGK
jgi:flagellar basal-body rod protein FlgB